MKQAKKHSKEAFTDVQSISLIANILSTHGEVMPKLDANDKWPNIDGHVEIQNEKILLGRLYVQVKTLPSNHQKKLSCPIEFLSNCELTPCLLLGVDNKNKRIYWRYFDSYEIQKIDFNKNKRSKTIVFETFFDYENKDYIEKWKEIADLNIRRFNRHDELEKIIKDNSIFKIGESDSDFINIHRFLDELNNLLDGDYRVVKHLYYGGAWKVGFGYFDYSLKKVAYTLYPIQAQVNDVQIKKIISIDQANKHIRSLGLTVHGLENPIEERYQKYANEVVYSKLSKLLDRKALNHKDINFLSEEYIFAFIDKFYKQMGLEQKNEYTVKEVDFAFNTYLPLWLKYSHEFLNDLKRNDYQKRVTTGHASFYDPSRIDDLNKEERSRIKDVVENAIKKGKAPSIIPVRSNAMPFGLFVEFLESIKTTKNKIKRVYIPKNFARLDGKVSWTYNALSKEGAEKNLGVFFANLPAVYSSFVDNNFPTISERLSLYRGADKIIIFCNLQDEYREFGPTYSMIYLKSNDVQSEQSLVINLSEEEIGQIDIIQIMRDGEMQFRGKSYKAVEAKSGALNFIYDDMPMLNFIYDELQQRVKRDLLD